MIAGNNLKLIKLVKGLLSEWLQITLCLFMVVQLQTFGFTYQYEY